MCVSAITGTGLNSVEASTLTTFQQVVMFVLLLLGHAILISITVLHVRKRAFQHKFKGISHALAQRTAQGAPAPNLYEERNDDKSHPMTQDIPMEISSRSSVGIHIQSANTEEGVSYDPTPKTGVDQSSNLKFENDRARNSCHSLNKAQLLPMGIWRGTQKYFESKGLISRNSQFHGLTAAERDRLQGVEYKAVSFLSVIVPIYWASFLCCGILGMGTWLELNKPQVPRDNGLSPFWTGAFFAVSAFVNSGMGILDANMTALQTDAYPLVTMGLLILAGNTLYPCFLRLIIWTMRRMMPNRPAWKTWRVTLDFILDHPRRVYTNLFPARHTWYLVATVIIFNGIDWAGFEVLSIGNKEIEGLPTAYRIMDGLFQALAVRAGGFSVVTISDLRQGLLVLYVLMMYVSPFPVLVTMRHTNVYEERSLGIYAEDETLYDSNQRPSNNITDLVRRHLLLTKEGTRRHFLREQLKDQLSHDLWWIALAVFFISIIESSNYTKDPVGYSTFNILFEVISAYGCVGISTGYPGRDLSFCGVWHSLSKLILAAVALRGRHRGLPVAIDKAIMLPSESNAQAWAEEEDAVLRREQVGPGAV
ncbi:putative potassium transporter [Aspergillus mulundensis]|uniref:Putative Cation transporter n=1 Tax=Aspergillus mulundensis TaxID=1810919 RepID=A0A3D8SV77_9EURO|nr:putative Cation transporter [Aspergillus mulundensis]RDW90222.1 putative Cation transporter [Aspergillus mulundensis]